MDDRSDGWGAGGGSSDAAVSATTGTTEPDGNPAGLPPRAGEPAVAAPDVNQRFSAGTRPPVPESWWRIAGAWRLARGGVWRVAVAEESMSPALAPGDWLLLDPTTRGWPRRGSVVVVREPDSDVLAVKRIAAGPGDRIHTGPGTLVLGDDEAWLLGDNRNDSLDSRRYGPVPLEALVGRAWFRYAPAGRIGIIGRPKQFRRSRT